MPKLLPFPAHRVQHTARSLLRLTASRKQLGKTAWWRNRPDPPEPLGNMLQRLAKHRPEVVLVIESVVAELLIQIDQLDPSPR